jgi:hypothetical protein
MRLRSLATLFGLFALVLSTGCCCCQHWRECHRPFRCRKCGGCSSCVTAGYTPCECGGEPPVIAPGPPAGVIMPGPVVPAPMPRATSTTTGTTTGLLR